MRFVRLTLLLLWLAPAVYAEGLPDLGDASQALLSPQQERQLGESIMREIRNSNGFLDDPEITDYLNNLGYRLVANSPETRQQFEFFVIRDNSINAFALPGGFIGVHTGLLLATQSESELASVLAHEISHVEQKHLARMLSQQRQSSLTSLAALAVAILSARSDAQVSQAALATAQAGAMQSQLNFTREHEREADRIGLQILEKGGFDVHAMPTFFERLQKATRLYEGNAPSYLRTHPLTFERIADVQNRTQSLAYRQVADSAEFHLVRAMLRASFDDAREAATYFESSLKEKRYAMEAASRYGLTLALLRAKNYARAKQEMAALRKLLPRHPMVETLDGQLKLAAGDNDAALRLYREALKNFPHYRNLVYDYAEALLQNRRAGEALQLINSQLQFTPDDYHLYALQARGYAATGKTMLQHRAQAEAYARFGNLGAAIEQLQFALKSAEGDFYQISSIESRLRELQALDREQQTPPMP
ncbi:MAG: M48 family metalloprotease [Pseudomonadota bacterium]